MSLKAVNCLPSNQRILSVMSLGGDHGRGGPGMRGRGGMDRGGRGGDHGGGFRGRGKRASEAGAVVALPWRTLAAEAGGVWDPPGKLMEIMCVKRSSASSHQTNQLLMDTWASHI